ncbi:hypothetical protein [Persephonella sp.]
MKRSLSTLIAVIFFAVSCAPLKKEKSCEIWFEKVKTASYGDKNYFIRGNIFIHGAYTVFYGDLGKRTFLTVRSPFGRKLFSISYQNSQICLLLPDLPEKCGKDLDIYWDYLNVKTPFDLKSLLTGRFKIGEDADYRCINGNLVVEYNGMEIFYEGLRTKEVNFKDFSAYYYYEDGKIKKIVIREKGKEIFRIYVRELREV